jgi:hypothetical protein
MNNLTKWEVTYLDGVTDMNQAKPKSTFHCKDELHLFTELNKYIARHTIYLDEIVEIRREDFNNPLPKEYIANRTTMNKSFN